MSLQEKLAQDQDFVYKIRTLLHDKFCEGDIMQMHKESHMDDVIRKQKILMDYFITGDNNNYFKISYSGLGRSMYDWLKEEVLSNYENCSYKEDPSGFELDKFRISMTDCFKDGTVEEPSLGFLNFLPYRYSYKEEYDFYEHQMDAIQEVRRIARHLKENPNVKGFTYQPQRITLTGTYLKED